MNKAILFNFLVDKENNQIKVERSFNAPVDLVWAAWTEADILDQWWAPKPWIARTKSMDFREGGHWVYAMVSPENEEHWGRVDYIKILPEKYFSAYDGFCDADGIPNTALPRNKWENNFTEHGNETFVNILLSFDTLEDLEKIIAMGFKEGFTAGLENLDHYIASQFYLRKQNKPNNRARVSFYLNFPGNTEEAFLFYKSVFKTDFTNGIQRFGEIPADPNQPPLAEEVKEMVLHVELPILGGHILMGTDAPKEFGMTVNYGNNMHINLEPESQEETQRLFDELSVDGKIEMPLQDMFWGAYYGSFTDKYGINWMVNFQNK
ncbi:SRPBCC domain-containing protein [Algoriphagus sp. D3-2-R+10]|uniref:SRPBCC domain-containing protein n=1 Tax=Algoriphagus aurantiacus TaxID=3103948 RepID=UPI002B38ACBA|nr:SRPBCC domain-containing protein [Algoriphagus sp. D3-2-R+10]MEB2778143.1 SRPBCC domain-containing protein [Algoriphagus sp. D3-2-R+10]